ncbi:MAG: hypothetical protein NT065_04130 [Chlamydiae bacterium]|nr:hypothetical protein [Chlamydiota bacterium]
MSITLESTSLDGKRLTATFLPSFGMNLVSFKKDGIEVIDQSTTPLFEERRAGLGALIGPHFHHRPLNKIAPVAFQDRFFHIAAIKAKGIDEPFSHGVARYAPWSCTHTATSLHAKVSGNDIWNGVLVSSLEGFDFTMYLDVQLNSHGLFLELSVDSQEPAVVGYHYYYAIDKRAELVIHQPQMEYFNGKQVVAVPDNWIVGNDVKPPLSGALDFGFYPKDPQQPSHVRLNTSSYTMQIEYQSHTEESSLQIYRPENAGFVCIEPLSATYPKNPKLLSSGVNLHLQII